VKIADSYIDQNNLQGAKEFTITADWGLYLGYKVGILAKIANGYMDQNKLQDAEAFIDTMDWYAHTGYVDSLKARVKSAQDSAKKPIISN